MPSTANLENKVTIRAAKTLLTPEEYLLKEREAEFKSEFRDGQIIAMPGASRHHCLISGNIFGELYIQVAQDDMRVEQHVRKNGKWDLTRFSSLNDLLQLGSIACQLAIKAIYEKVRF